MRKEIVETIKSLKEGDLIVIHTQLGGTYTRLSESQQEREGGTRATILPGPNLTLEGKFHKVLTKCPDGNIGPFVDNYLQVHSYGDKPVYIETSYNIKLVGWSTGEKITSIPFRNISSIQVQ